MTETNEEAVPEDAPAPPDPIRMVTLELRRAAGLLNDIRLRLDALNTERGVPIKNTMARLTKAREYLQNAHEYWDHDVVNGNAKMTKSEQQRAEGFELS